MLGLDLAAAGAAAGHDVIAMSRAQLDVVDAAAVRAAVDESRPDVVVNCAAYTNVDGAESEEAVAVAVNGDGAGHVAAAASGAGAWTIHVSTDYVFDGRASLPYVESDAVGPLSAYGRSKLAGERAVASAAPSSHTIVRSSWLFGAGGPCFPATMLRLGATREELSVVDDQIGCPTFTGHLAEALIGLAAEGAARRGSATILHVAGGGQCSWYEFAREIMARGGLSCDVRPGKTADLGRPAPRPAYSVLRSERDAPELPHWRDGLASYLSLVGVPSR
jgi:dTDP-4-dehydrorhamnose reductase